MSFEFCLLKIHLLITVFNMYHVHVRNSEKKYSTSIFLYEVVIYFNICMDFSHL